MQIFYYKSVLLYIIISIAKLWLTMITIIKQKLKFTQKFLKNQYTTHKTQNAQLKSNLAHCWNKI